MGLHVMTLTIHLGPWLVTAILFLLGFLFLMRDGRQCGGGGPLMFLGLALWFSIPFVLLGWWLR